MALVIKQWSARVDRGDDGEHVRIHGRESGLVSFVLSLVGIDPTTTLTIDDKSLRLARGSLAGFERSLIPLQNAASAGYGYSKPWKRAVVLGMLGILALSIPIVGWLVGIALLVYAPLGYFLNKELYVMVVDTGSKAHRIEFKRSIIEGQNIDEKAAEHIVGILEMLMLGLKVPRTVADASGAPVDAAKSELSGLAERALERANAAKTDASRLVDQAAHKIGAVLASTKGASAEAALDKRVCPGCGTQAHAGDIYCASCGKRLTP